MATEKLKQQFRCESDSEDEFFDALASEEEKDGASSHASRSNINIDGLHICDERASGDNTLSLADNVQSEVEGVNAASESGAKNSSGTGHIEAHKDTVTRSDDNDDEKERTRGTNPSEDQSSIPDVADVHEGLLAEEEEGEIKDEARTESIVVEEEQQQEESPDEEQRRTEREDAMTEEEREILKNQGQDHKARGNELFKENEFLDAVSEYSQALEVCPLCYKKERSIMYANRAACRVRREQYEMAVKDCDKALELHPVYLKVWLRRANTYELLEKLDEALADFQKVLELDPGCYEARAACIRLPDQIKERNEKLKAEMFGKLKDLGNLVLRPFGLSTDNFQMQQDPNTGSYSVNFQQNPGNGNH